MIIIIFFIILLLMVLKFGGSESITLYVFEGNSKKTEFEKKILKQIKKYLYYRKIIDSGFENVKKYETYLFTKHLFTKKERLDKLRKMPFFASFDSFDSFDSFFAEGEKREGEKREIDFSFKKVKNAKEIKIPLRRPLKNFGHKYTKQDLILTNIKYFVLESIAYGNNWTMMKKAESDFFSKNGFIEMFASPFNSRTKYFCSYFKSDKPFGSLGNYYKISFDSFFAEGEKREGEKREGEKRDEKRELRLLFNPPSGWNLAEHIQKTVFELLETKNIICMVGVSGRMPEDFINKYKNHPKLQKWFINDFCYDFVNKVYKNMKGREWLEFILSNGSKLKVPDFPKESPYEKN